MSWPLFMLFVGIFFVFVTGNSLGAYTKETDPKGIRAAAILVKLVIDILIIVGALNQLGVL